MYLAKNYEYLIGLNGFSEIMLRNHFSLYEGYVKNMNTILEKWQNNSLDMTSIEASEISRRMGWEFNGMKLHELYFENLSKEKINLNLESNLAIKIHQIYGSLENFKNIFQQVAKTRGIGWVALVKGEKENELFTIWIDEHNTGHLVNSKIILILDVFEHAFMIDYGLKRADYINVFLDNINWSVCQERFDNS